MRLTNGLKEGDVGLLQAGFELIGYDFIFFKKNKNKVRINDDKGKRIGTLFISSNPNMYFFSIYNNIEIGHSLLNHVIDVQCNKTSLHIWSHDGINLHFRNKKYNNTNS